MRTLASASVAKDKTKCKVLQESQEKIVPKHVHSIRATKVAILGIIYVTERSGQGQS